MYYNLKNDISLVVKTSFLKAEDGVNLNDKGEDQSKQSQLQCNDQ